MKFLKSLFKLGDDNQNQKGGKSSTNLQGQSITINQGLTYSDAKDIALDVFKQNSLELSSKAADIACLRAEEIVNQFLGRLEQESPEAVKSMQDPGFQHSIFSAQREYAKTGDKKIGNILVDILVDRANEQERSLKQIVLDESISVISKLTMKQMNALSLIFLLRYTQNYSNINHEKIGLYIREYLMPFTDDLTKELSTYQHLQYCGCGAVGSFERSLENIFLRTYRALFSKGFDGDELKEIGPNSSDYSELIIPCLNDENQFQFGLLNEQEIIKRFEDDDSEEANKIQTEMNHLAKKNLMSDIEVKAKLLEIVPESVVLFDFWNKSSMKFMTLTSVGIAIAHANIKSRTDKEIDLSIWIK